MQLQSKRNLTPKTNHMFKKLRLLSLIVISIAVFSFIFYNINQTDEITELKQKHKTFLNNSPFKETKN